MERRFSRKQLFDLMWSKPIKDLAPEFGISDVALAKFCGGKEIPLPGRGYWAKRAAGKPTPPHLLPCRALGMSETIVIGRSNWSCRQEEEAQLMAEEVQPPPDFPEPPGELVDRVKKVVGKVTYIRDLHRIHGAISRLLEDDAKRAEKRATTAYPSYSDEAQFDSPFERRRLKIANSILLASAKLGMIGGARGKNPSEFSISAPAGVTIDFLLDAPQKPNQRPHEWRPVSATNRPSTDPLQLAIRWRHEKEDCLRLVWNESREEPLEGLLQEIVVGLVVALEMSVRAGELEHHRWQVERKARLIEAARRREEKAESARLARMQRQEDLRLDHLMSGAMSLRLAEDLRSYIRAVREANQTSPNPRPCGEMEQWVAWASAQVKCIDPILNGSFLMEPQDDAGEGDPHKSRPSMKDTLNSQDKQPAWHPNRWYERNGR